MRCVILCLLTGCTLPNPGLVLDDPDMTRQEPVIEVDLLGYSLPDMTKNNPDMAGPMQPSDMLTPADLRQPQPDLTPVADLLPHPADLTPQPDLTPPPPPADMAQPPCGNPGQACCPGSVCTYYGYECNGSQCVVAPCGAPGQPCCVVSTGYACNNWNNCTSMAGGAKCVECGKTGEPLCNPGTSTTGQCQTNYINWSGTSCIHCGNYSEYCCTGNVCAQGSCLSGAGVCEP
jgi:hypothetical protein